MSTLTVLYVGVLTCSGILFLFSLLRFSLSDRGGTLFFFSAILFFVLLFIVPAGVIFLLVIMMRDFRF